MEVHGLARPLLEGNYVSGSLVASSQSLEDSWAQLWEWLISAPADSPGTRLKMRLRNRWY